ncbi:nicotinate-nucleotide--dimethylbenzimidazole phosphoribosyltransferase [Vibrio paucivorans]|uniref:Nicotinate-nucleotide--dimethylbenzimidazole phosphoribosyltransferase n=1 Tax=Vibrio paucivorans TaxID=2829489 RepID=A0A9X3CIG0_9VIBR|nr:nicotinate-nucleotide--dimethylbenzimidazole phosphoribosyltransferase [Vibrio paucivorans]MCW8336270.1 nicotinate-nucleotide--dimethylbenzimidazole phosphoribosyltransferase [Vibrio paucivorans]
MLDTIHSEVIQHRIDQKTKPIGALGQLEKLAHHLALIQSQGKRDAVTNISLTKPTILVFAGDHGIAEEGVSIAPSAVTQQMVYNFLAGGAAINCFCRSNDVDMWVVDTGILSPIQTDSSRLIEQRLGEGTSNFAHQSAMSPETVQRGLQLGQSVAERVIDSGSNILMFGEMGIGNTSSASAIICALDDIKPQDAVGLGTGINPQQLAKKVDVVAKGVERCKSVTPQQVLAEVGGFEIVQMVGAFLAAGKRQTPVLVDGFIVSVAAYVATLIDPQCRDYMIFAHKSEEAAHQFVLNKLDAQPLLDLGLRLGEGTGAVLAMPLLRAAAEFYNTMASFEDAGVTV